MKRSNGFTLIEVLVVVAIIALLISILLPSLAAARAQSRTTLCLANLHQAGIAINTYSVENKGYVPRGGNVDNYFSKTSPEVHWTAVVLRQLGSNMSGIVAAANRDGKLLSQLLWEAMKKQPVFHCPERASEASADEAVSYCVNAFGKKLGDPEVRKPTQLSDWKHPGKVIYLTEIERSTRSSTILTAFKEKDLSYFDVYEADHLPSAPTGQRRVARAMHQKRNTDALFADGHCEPVHSMPRAGEAEFD
ncbi:MAG TPA: prepilin-type N-terminal cleavage/methylation domain-containing protein, partial [Phycisphaerae bacterium]|nr:prepilin-type N-terminal cleavage/methylation domain-containing protein [Phycisphaerae bacterium]